MLSKSRILKVDGVFGHVFKKLGGFGTCFLKFILSRLHFRKFEVQAHAVKHLRPAVPKHVKPMGKIHWQCQQARQQLRFFRIPLPQAHGYK